MNNPRRQPNLTSHFFILIFCDPGTHPLNPPLPPLQSGSSLKLPTGQFLYGRSCKEGANPRYAEYYESILRNKSIFMFHYFVLRSETKNPRTCSIIIIISETLSRDLPSLRSREVLC